MFHRAYRYRLYPTAEQEIRLREWAGAAGIYRIMHNVEGGRSYVGSAKCLLRRARNHVSLLRGGRHHSKALQGAWDRHGPDAFIIEVLEIVDCLENLTSREQHWIDELQSFVGQNGYNILPRARSPLGRKHSEETKAKIKRAHLGRQHSDEHRRNNAEARKGKRLSAESYAKGAAKRRGRPRSPEATAKAAASNRGQTRTREARERMSAWQKGKPPSPKLRAALAVISANNRGRTHSEETKAIMRQRALVREAEKRANRQ